MDRKTKRIGILGRVGVGKSIIASNLSEALVREGYKVLLIGTDISLSSTLLVRGFADIPSVLQDYREKYSIRLQDYIIKSQIGVYCMELGSIEPGSGCLAKGLSHIDEMLTAQGVLEEYQIDYILYDIAGDVACTGFILPIREGVMDQCLIITNGNMASLSTANTLLSGITKKGLIPSNTCLVGNLSDVFHTRSFLTEYAEIVNIPILSFIEFSPIMRDSYLAEKTIYQINPESSMVEAFRDMALSMIDMEEKTKMKPFEQRSLLQWQQAWKKKELDYNRGIIDVDYSSNI
ncbi:MAG: nifH [Herbinix sp.]|jgi:nitrogenase iron protein NifH|nr:nifH [Herbinix sp.]